MTERELDRLLAEDGYGVREVLDSDREGGAMVWELWELMDSNIGHIVGYFETAEEVCDFVGIEG